MYLGYHLRLQKYVVVKQLKGNFSADFLMRTEVDILKNLHHPYLPQIYDYIQEHNSVYTVIDYVDGYDLEAHIKGKTKFPEQVLKRYLRQIAEVLDYLHSQNRPVIHSDIKPGNIIINQEGNAILIDFNTSIGGNQGNILGLTLPYASPEQIQLAQYAVYGQQPSFDLDGRSDLFSLGATFYELICGIRPTPGVPPVPLHTMGISEYSRDFLVLIDRLIEYDREKRIKSAKKLVAAIDRLDSSYRTYFALRCVSLLVSAALIGGGLYCLIRGNRMKITESYRTEYNAVVTMISQGYLDRAEEAVDEILADSEMQAYLRNEPVELARMYHVMGDICYYREDYGTAAAYYKYAVNASSSLEREEYATFLRDASIAYAQYGDLDSARVLLEQAQNSYASTDDLKLISLVIEARSGNMEQCVQTAQQLLATSRNNELCLRAALTVASLAEEVDVRIQWLETARKYDTGKTSVRGLAAAYGEKAQAASSESERQAALQQATLLYEQICDSRYASSNDMLNYSIILRMAGKDQQALSVLKSALQYDPENYRIMANLCFIYYELGDHTQASAYCQTAIQAWRADTSADKLSESDEEIQNLLEIGRRFGIGGV